MLACEQAPKWGIGRKKKIGEPGELSAVWGRPLSKLDFCIRPIPHLGACSQAIEYESGR